MGRAAYHGPYPRQKGRKGNVQNALLWPATRRGSEAKGESLSEGKAISIGGVQWRRADQGTASQVAARHPPPPPPAPPAPPAPHAKAQPWKCTGPFCTPIRYTGIEVKDPFDDVHVKGHLHPWMYKDIAGGQTLRSTQGVGGEGKGGKERGKRRGTDGSDSGAGVAEKVEGWG